MLLVHDGEREVAERHALLDERVGPDDEVHAAVGDAGQDASAVCARHGRREHRVGRGGPGTRVVRAVGRVEQRALSGRRRPAAGRGDLQVRDESHALQQRRDRALVLAGQHLRRRHDRRLSTRLDRHQARVDGHEGLPRPDVALQQHVHRPWRGHRRADLLDRPRLGLRGLERQGGQEPVGQLAVRAVPQAGALRLQAVLPESDPELQGEQLVELQPFHGPRQLLGVLGEMHVAERRVEILQTFRAHELGGRRVGDRGKPFQRPEDELPDRSRGDPLGRGVDRRDPSGVDQVPFLAAEDLRLQVGELQAAPVPRDGARDRRLDPLAIDVRRPRLVEEREVQVPGAVGDRHGDHRLPSPGRSLRDGVDAGDDRGVLPDPQITDPLDGRSIDVAARVVSNQVPDRPDPHAGEDGVRLLPLLAQARATRRELPVHVEDRGVERQGGGSSHFRSGSTIPV